MKISDPFSSDDETVISHVSAVSGSSSRVREMARERDDRERAELSARTMEDDLRETRTKVYTRTITKVIIPLQRALRKTRSRKDRVALFQSEINFRNEIIKIEKKDRPKKVQIDVSPSTFDEDTAYDSEGSRHQGMYANYEYDKFCCGNGFRCSIQ